MKVANPHTRFTDMTNSTEYTCPCCGFIIFDEPPGSYAICPICFWEDDPVQILDPSYAGGANKPNLMACQKYFQEHGACDSAATGKARSPTNLNKKDAGWRLASAADCTLRRTPASLSCKRSNDLKVWYYWRRA